MMHIDPSFAAILEQLALQARIGWAVALLSLGLLTLLIIRLSVHFRIHREEKLQRQLGKLHSSQEATASMEYLLVLIPFLIIVMTVWQVAFMLNARMHVGYSAYAAARSASVLIPMKTDDEDVGELKALGSNDSAKWKRIRRASIPGTIAISPGSAADAAGVAAANAVTRAITGGGGFNPPAAPDAAMIARLTVMSMHMCNTPPFCGPAALNSGTRRTRAVVKDYYAQNMTTVFINNQDHSKTQKFAGTLDANGDENGQEQDAITIRVEYIFYMNVPWVGRMLQAVFQDSANPVANQAAALINYPSITLFQETAINTWFRKRATEPCT
jgi:hypothetical protein